MQAFVVRLDPPRDAQLCIVNGRGPELFERNGQQAELPPYLDVAGHAQRYGRLLGNVETVADGLALLDERYPAVGYVTIHLADDEWGNEKMRQVADGYFQQHPDCQFVHVCEHAGWHLGFRRDGSIWTTANDMADMRDCYPQPALGCQETIRR